MDIALEICDTFAFDYAYAKLFPARTIPYDLANGALSNFTAKAASSWQYEPATSLFSLEPSNAAYATSVPRDNIFRQFVNLFLMTWLVFDSSGS